MAAKPVPPSTSKQTIKRKCIVPGCLGNDLDSSLSFHHFPSDPDVKEEWIQFIKTRKPNFVFKKYMNICSRHFTRECFERVPEVVEKIKESCGSIPLLRPNWLIKGSIPSIYNPLTEEAGYMPSLPKKNPLSDISQDESSEHVIVNPEKKRRITVRIIYKNLI